MEDQKLLQDMGIAEERERERERKNVNFLEKKILLVSMLSYLLLTR